MVKIIEVSGIESGKRIFKLNLWFISFQLTEVQLYRILKYIFLSIGILFIITLFQYLIFFQHCQFNFFNWKGKLTCPNENISVISPAIGLQNTGIYLRNGEILNISISGAVHVSGYQPYNRAQAIRCVLYENLDEEYKRDYLDGFKSMDEYPNNPEPCYDYYSNGKTNKLNIKKT